ncbi:LuxR C-terminal-related transcriptional regulator [Marixanthomonas spongiae]|uniref:HTH luxR-type domain-containing protein n=1 Tax=Marixanthomonas spongiae TaxID=2174845 RepID=A0A2U0I0J5_9FLAO|nr:LuxR C-terminal-related transcriptional regulator [Marixanthomonas spongiae]PVW14626.1 hypothetical protein DDV96_08855 [Marixanthomonas spongiae]
MFLQTNTHNNNIPLDPSIAGVLKQISLICKDQHQIMVSVFDVKQKLFLFCSDSFEKILGYSGNTVGLGGWKFWQRKIDPGHIKIFQQQLSETLRNSKENLSNETKFSAYRFKDAKGNWRVLKQEISVFKKEKTCLLLNFFFDVSPKVHISELLDITEKKLLTTSPIPVEISAREHQVLNLLAEGHSTKKIAQLLFISSHTVTSHRKHLLQKFEVKNTAQLINKAARQHTL